MVNLGIIRGGYTFQPAFMGQYPHRRAVQWVQHVPRAAFSQSALHEIGSAITLFQVSTHAEEFRAALEGQSTGAEDVDEDTAGDVSVQVEETTEDFIIKRLKTKLGDHEFEKFTAHLLTCMGYHARVTQKSGDGGIDVIAHKDELGFEPPIIKVQCKQTLDQIGRPKVQELHGAVEHGEHGLFVTLGGFSAEARTFERSKPNLRLIDGNTLIELIYAHYERFDTRYKMLLPLKRTYIPGAVLTTVD
jgi:restriction system protein